VAAFLLPPARALLSFVWVAWASRFCHYCDIVQLISVARLHTFKPTTLSAKVEMHC